MNTERVNFQNSLEQTIAGRLYYNNPSSEKGVVFCHGLFSTKDGYKITRLAPLIVEAGYTLLTFDFSFVGESGGSISDLSIIQEADDLHNAVLFFRNRGIRDLHIIGSSMGGVVSLLYSSGNSGVSSLTLIATPVNLKALALNIIGIDVSALPDDGMTGVEGIMIKNSFFKELNSIRITDAVKNINMPVQIIHGDMDLVVPVDNAYILQNTIKPEPKLVIIKDGSHSLNEETSFNIVKSNITRWLGLF